MYLTIFYSSVPLKRFHHKSCNKARLTRGIKTSCIHKRKLFFNSELSNSNDPKLTNYYKRYCRILTSAIKLAKKRYYNSILNYSNNKTTWNIIKNTSNIKPNTLNITSINVNGNLSFNGQIIAETFNKYFVSVAQNIHVNNHTANAPSNHENPISYLSRAFNQPFPSINLKCVSLRNRRHNKVTQNKKFTWI